MHCHYKDILKLADKAPKWFDENAVPRFCAFAPDECANIYADEVVLLLIRCQNCHHPFRVCISTSHSERMIQTVRMRAWGETLDPSKKVEEIGPLATRIQGLHYGDPPNISCCPAGPTMGSDPIKVIEFWDRLDPMDRRGNREWKRRRELEVRLDDEDE
jgi:hypothetical protein